MWQAPTEAEFDALAGLEREGTWRVQQRAVRVTNLDKELHPGRDGERAITKREVIAYRAAIAPHEPRWAFIDLVPGTCRLHLRRHQCLGRMLSRMIAQTVPELVSWEWHKERRQGRARLDHTQNAINKTLVAPFSVRPATGAPVSVPIEWAELDDPDLRPDRQTIRTVLDHLETGDPLRPLIGLDQSLAQL